jgi:cellulose synthase/poly-beta-1,6-N-acetylglucosamine synthase-like glycosyltransferase
MVELLFWIFIFIVFYSYLGYGLIIYLLRQIKRFFFNSSLNSSQEYEPEVTLFVAAYNERDFVQKKIENSFNLDYPPEKVKHIWVTDGSDDGTPDLLDAFDQIEVHHEPIRNGKIGAINRGMKYVNTSIVIFSDCNTILSPNSIKEIVHQFKNPKVGCVAGEKRITRNKKDIAVNAGEGFYWNYESCLKRWEADINSAMGAVGELFAIRKELFKEVEPDTLLDDFVISMRIAMMGYKIAYTPKAHAIENASVSVKEELKRKVRIAAGGIQSMIRLKGLFNFFKYPVLSFQYISHKVLRWTIVPISLPLIFVLNFILLFKYPFYSLYHILFAIQIIFYTLAIIGSFFENKKIMLKIIFIPYYLFFMNYAVFKGFLRFVTGKQSHNWERAKRILG